MFKKLIIILLLLITLPGYSQFLYAEDTEPSYTKLRNIDRGTFNEYRYKITDEFFTFRGNYDIEGKIDIVSANKILDLAKVGYKYLPESLSNKNYYNYLKTSIEKGIKYPLNSSNYTSILTAIENFLDKTNIKTIKGNVEAFPKEGNAPLNVTLRGNVVDPTGTKIPSYNYTWWMYEDGKRKILGNNISLNHLFTEEGNFSIFLDVKSAHKNNGGFTDVLSFSSRADIKIKEKIASVILKVNSYSLKNDNELKFTPDEGRYGLLIDGTSSTPTSGSKFIKTTWDFGNGIIKSYKGSPKVERVIYAKEGVFDVSLKLQTNELKTIERKFQISIHDPIATIKSSAEEGYLGDKFTFSAQKTGNNKNLSYAWEIIDLKADEIISRKSGTLFTYTFKNKGKYNVKMKVTQPSGEIDNDNQIININSRAPNADFISSIPFSYKPNKVFFDATKSFDPDYSDDGKLKYVWIIDGDRVKLSDSNFNGSTGYFTFDSIGEHSVTLEVEDPDNISSIKKSTVNIKSILAVEFFAFPRVAQRENVLRFVSNSPEAKFYEWDFGDGITKGGRDTNIAHVYNKSGIFNVKLKVRDINDNINTFVKNVYIGESDSPYSFISITDSSKEDIYFDESACDGKGAYIVNRVDSVMFSGKESIDITGETTGLTYSWKLGKQTYKNSASFTKRFDELGCFPIKLSVKSISNGKSHSTIANVEVRNLKPILSSLDVRVVDSTTDPVVVNVSALGSKDRDGVIQSYLWYYYTDIDSEPQDFRATKLPSTSFVLPKVTGNYYFVVVMKDNNEERINSEEITGSKYFMTLTGDNLNTPLVQLKINDSTIAIGEEAIFTANVENILGQDLTKKVKYSWDFDGDGFYDQDTNSNTITHKYIKSGEIHAKVKAKYKGFSNTKTVTVDVSNILKPDFGYISIGNKFIFFYNGVGAANTYEWILGDGTIIQNKKSFIHEYKDGLVSHIITLKISEGTKVKSIEKKVIKNVKNRILARKKGLIAFTSPQINSKNEIVLNKEGDNIFIYLGESKDNILNYVIDNDIDYDSSLNGTSDDDEDNIGDNSFTDGSVFKVKLNDKKYQKVRLYIKGQDGYIIDSKDVTIIKDYIEEKEIDINGIVFLGISDSIRFKIEKLKNYIDLLPKEYKLKGSMYVQKLQEEWSDDREKTNIILEFEGFIDEIGVQNGEEIINLLEGLLVEGQEDKSEKAVTYTALKNLIPSTIVCKNEETLKETLCYDTMVAKLDAINSNDNIDENKLLGTEILKVIAVDTVMTNKEKTDFKAILKTFIYGGVVNIPEKEIQEVEQTVDGNGSAILTLVVNIFKWIIIIILVLLGFIALFYLYFLISNKDKNIGFQDFIIEKTSGEKKITSKVEDTFEEDILSELKLKEEKEIELKKEEVEKKEIESNNEGKITEDTHTSNISNTKKETTNKIEEVPDWLKGNFSEELKTEELKTEESKTEIDIKEQSNNKKNNIRTEKKSILKKENKPVNENNDYNKKEDNIPDWLKGSFSDEGQKKEEKSIDIVTESLSTGKVENKKEDDNIPDWLRGSFSEDINNINEETKSNDIINKDKIFITDKKNKQVIKEGENDKNVLSASKKDKNDIKNQSNKTNISENKNVNSNKKPIKKDKKKIDTKVTKVLGDKESNKIDKDNELWDDGMKVPDWLKSDDK